MSRFTTGLIGGIAVGLIIGVGSSMTDDKHRRRVMREGKRSLKKAGHVFDDFKSQF